MIWAPARRTSAGWRPRTAPWVPTGMNAGVATAPWGSERVPARASPSVASGVNSNTGRNSTTRRVKMEGGSRAAPLLHTMAIASP